MAQYHLNRIAARLEADFQSLIDMSDWATRRAEDRKSAFLSRALAALCIKSLAKVDANRAAGAVVDTFDDGGIDALMFDQGTDTFYFVQSKWSAAGTKPMNGAAGSKFADGIGRILSARLDGFNDKVKSKEPEIRAALYSTRPVKFVLVAAHSAVAAIAAPGRQRIDALVDDLNSSDQIATVHYLNQADVYRLLTSPADLPKISLAISLRDWGSITQPYRAYYGRVNVAEVADWWHRYNDALCSRNLRHFFQTSDVNDALHATLEDEAHHFWYFNNGITIICDSIVKSPIGTPRTDLGIFNCEGISVVNGAQTVGTVGATLMAPPLAEAAEGGVANAWVQVRIISLQGSPAGFDRRITIATNFQNAVTKRDFAAMDPTQHRLATEFAIDRRRYVYKSGEVDPKGEEGCSITEATQALGCAASIDIAVQVKREIGEMWGRTDAPPYTDLFNEELTSLKVWRAVLVMRRVDEELQVLSKSEHIPRADMVAIHLNRLILHLVFRDADLRRLDHDECDIADLLRVAQMAAKEQFMRVAAYMETNHQSEYLASFSKNRVKCNTTVHALLSGSVVPVKDEKPKGQLDLLKGLPGHGS
ncbi:MAG: AIPR family protein [Reyranella sp.]|uniref:AIPR family protein n=1 Tax=Reyranella sp. TaxID=1929291 RepID=UPI003D120A58